MAIQNKMFAGKTFTNTNNHKSMIRRNREYLLSSNVAQELNTYNYFGIFPTYNGVYDVKYDDNGKVITEGKDIGGPGAPGVRSIFNKFGAVLTGNMSGLDNLKGKTLEEIQNSFISGEDVKVSEFRIMNNTPLMDSAKTRKAIRQNSGCSVRELVRASEEGALGRAIYSYSDFMYCTHLGKMPNNYLITLRRFPIPVQDFIGGWGTGSSRSRVSDSSADDGRGGNRFVQQIGCMVTWLNTPGNDMSNILKYSYKMPFKSVDSEWIEDGSTADEQTGIFNAAAAMFDDSYRKQMSAGYGGTAVNTWMSKAFGNIKMPVVGSANNLIDSGRYDANAWNRWRDQNKVYGPVDAIKDTYMRDKVGLKMEQNIQLVFDYELRSYNGINPRQAMLDLLSNILHVTYSSGGFWRGGYYGGGMHQNSTFANLNVFQASGGATAFAAALWKDAQNGITSISEFFKRNGVRGSIEAIGKGLLKTLDGIGGMLIGSLLNKGGRPVRKQLTALLADDPAGFWHVTIGNPHHPIVSMGNMILTNTTIEHYGPLGIDDFPTGLRVTCDLTRGQSRDIRMIETMYMSGNDRIYHSMTEKVIDMYKNAAQYKSSGTRIENIGNSNKADSSNSTDQMIKAGDSIEATKIKGNSLSDVQKILKKYFGETNEYSIRYAASDQEFGSESKLVQKALDDASKK